MRGAATTLLAAACVAGLMAGPPQASAAPSPSGSPDRVTATHTVTLVTGETVALRTFASGRQDATVQPGPDGAPAAFRSLRVADDLYLIPEEADPYLAAGRLDRELFNVTKLVSYGYDDAHRATIPVIATYTGAPAKSGQALADVDTPDGATRTRVLPSTDALALTAHKKSARTFWKSVRDDTAATATTAPRLAAGMAKLWLDKPVKAVLDKSVPQIGAPQAWAAGYDGTGVDVAVLDTGIDLTHRDLTERVRQTRNFSSSPDMVDRHGHGTHVASTIAGSGAASAGAYRGAAPGADLLIGKVLGDDGSGSESGIIAGMQWAVDQGADVVSMSLGSQGPSDGSDPMSQAVEQLTASSGALFVIAAGNAGPGAGTISAPGAADSALTVGAVDRADQLANFSGRGPRPGDNAVKPEITAPGVGIVAARAAGTAMGTPVDADYTAANGTSMATPHVAGAAAILKQRHPDWTADRVKQVLTGTANRGKAYSAYWQGAGRVDVAQAIDATFYSSPSVVSLGAVGENAEPVVKQADYVNTTGSDLPLTLSMTAVNAFGAPAPAGMFTLGGTDVTVPAGGRAQVPVKFDPGVPSLSGDYTAVVTATAADGKAVRTTFGVTKTVRSFKLTVDVAGRDGAPAAVSPVDVFNIDTGQYLGGYTRNGTYTALVPEGRYSAMVMVTELDAGGSLTKDTTLGGDPQIDVTQDTALTVDARKGEEIRFSTPQESEPVGYKIGYMRQATSGSGLSNILTKSAQIWDHVYVIPTGAVTAGTFETVSSERRYAPVIRAAYEDRGGSIPLEQAVNAKRLDGIMTMEAVSVGAARPEDVAGRDLSGRIAVITRDPALKYADQIATAAGAGAAAAVIVNDRPGTFLVVLPGGNRRTATTIPAWSLNQDDGRTLLARAAADTAALKLHGIATSPFVYNAVYRVADRIPAHPELTVTRAASEVVDTVYHGTPNTLIGDTQAWYVPWEDGSVDAVDWFPTGTRRQEWFSAGGDWASPLDEIRWQHRVYPSATDISHVLLDKIRVRGAGGAAEDRWWGAANGPAGPEAATAYREGDTFNLSIPDLGDSGDGHFGWLQNGVRGDTESARIHRDGQQIFQGTRLALYGPVTTVPERATYRVALDTAHGPWFPLATSVNTAWTFESAHVDSGREVLPLLWPRYDLGVGDDNATAVHGTYHFGLSVLPQPGADTADLTGVELSYSVDDGATWRTAQVKPDEGGYDVTVRNPGAGGFVSLRVKAGDADGNQVEQTLIRAYAVR